MLMNTDILQIYFTGFDLITNYIVSEVKGKKMFKMK